MSVKATILESPKLTQYVYDIVNNLHLQNEHNYVKTTNPSNDAPYHGWYHTQCMVKNVFDGGVFYNLPRQALKHLVTAALFHDYDHTAGEQTDDVNISRAVSGYNKFTFKFDETVFKHNQLIDLEIIHLIKVTQFPFIHTPITIEEKIIRDADLLQMAEDHWYDQLIVRLGTEIQISRKIQHITELDMMKGQLQFLNRNMYFTTWATEIYDFVIFQRMIELQNKIDKIQLQEQSSQYI